MRAISAERLYAIADFQNIKLNSTISEIPDSVTSGTKVIGLLFYLQCLELDMAYKRYMMLRKQIADDKVKDILEFLEEERTKTYKELLDEIKDKEIE